MIRDDSGSGDIVDVKTHEGESSLRVVSGHDEMFTVHLNAQNISAEQGFMLIDLSDTTNWPHPGTRTGHIILLRMSVNINPSTAFRGDIQFGFLTGVDATDGEFNRIYTYHVEQQGTEIVDQLAWVGQGFDLELTEWFGPTTSSDTTWQTDVNLQGPDGNTSFPSGSGDFVMKITRTAGSVDVALLVCYETRA